MRMTHVGLIAIFLVTSGCSGTDTTPAPSESYSTVEEPLFTHTSKVVLTVEREDIVSSLPGALAQDTDLRNAWGLAFSPLGTAWVSANETGLSGVYDSNGGHALPSVTIPPPENGTPPSHPTGQVFNSTMGAFRGDAFIFVTEDGTISGWQGGLNAVLRKDNSASEAVYKGVTIAKHHSGKPRLYVTNFRAATIEVYDDNYERIDTRHRFKDFLIPRGFAPFNVQEINGLLFVTYAKQSADKEDDVAGPGNGFVDVFDPDGHLLSRLIARGALNSPWGLALAPKGFGNLEDHLLVGNFGDGKINVYDLDFRWWGIFASHDGVLGDEEGEPLVIDGLWALRFGLGVGGFSTTDLYFTAGPNDESEGVFGELDAISKKKHRPKKIW